MNIHGQLFWGSLGTRVLTHPHLNRENIMKIHENDDNPFQFRVPYVQVKASNP